MDPVQTHESLQSTRARHENKQYERASAELDNQEAPCLKATAHLNFDYHINTKIVLECLIFPKE